MIYSRHNKCRVKIAIVSLTQFRRYYFFIQLLYTFVFVRRSFFFFSFGKHNNDDGCVTQGVRLLGETRINLKYNLLVINKICIYKGEKVSRHDTRDERPSRQIQLSRISVITLDKLLRDSKLIILKTPLYRKLFSISHPFLPYRLNIKINKYIFIYIYIYIHIYIYIYIHIQIH